MQLKTKQRDIQSEIIHYIRHITKDLFKQSFQDLSREQAYVNQYFQEQQINDSESMEQERQFQEIQKTPSPIKDQIEQHKIDNFDRISAKKSSKKLPIFTQFESFWQSCKRNDFTTRITGRIQKISSRIQSNFQTPSRLPQSITYGFERKRYKNGNNQDNTVTISRRIDAVQNVSDGQGIKLQSLSLESPQTQNSF